MKKREILRYVGAAAMFLLGVFTVVHGAKWYEYIVLFLSGVIIIVGQRQWIFRRVVHRSQNEVRCGCNALLASSPYYLTCILLGMGYPMMIAGYSGAAPAWFRFGGILLMAICVLSWILMIWSWHWNDALFRADTVSIRGADGAYKRVELTREDIDTVEFTDVPLPYGRQEVATRIVLKDPSRGRKGSIILRAAMVTVPTESVLSALQTWLADRNDPELLDHIDRILRGCSATTSQAPHIWGSTYRDPAGARQKS